MKLNQKVIIVLVVLVLALTSFGFIAGIQATHNLTAAQTAPASAQVSLVDGGQPLPVFIPTPPVMKPNVSWNS
jgi:hypothetical protein